MPYCSLYLEFSSIQSNENKRKNWYTEFDLHDKDWDEVYVQSYFWSLVNNFYLNILIK